MRETQAYCLKRLLDVRGSLLSCELQCRISRSATDWYRPEVYTSCETSRLDPGMTLERTGLNGGKVPDWLRPSHSKWWESFWLAKTLPHDKRAVFNYLTLIIDSSTVTWSMALLSLEVQRETNSRSSREREAILSLHNTLPQVIKVSALYYKTIYNNHIAKINQE